MPANIFRGSLIGFTEGGRTLGPGPLIILFRYIGAGAILPLAFCIDLLMPSNNAIVFFMQDELAR